MNPQTRKCEEQVSRLCQPRENRSFSKALNSKSRSLEAGHRVTGFDTDPKKVQMLTAGKSYIEHIQQTKIQQYVNSRHFTATTDFAKLEEVDAILICVPTPLNEYREPDLSYVEETAKSIQP